MPMSSLTATDLVNLSLLAPRLTITVSPRFAFAGEGAEPLQRANATAHQLREVEEAARVAFGAGDGAVQRVRAL